MASPTYLVYYSTLLLWITTCCLLIPYTAPQVMWTMIYVDGKSQIDLWTQEAKGCLCPWNRTNNQCACCVADGGCPCGMSSPNRCTQCGLEEYCNHMCNVTIVSTELKAKSGKSFGQIKSPSLEGPDACWYTFIPSSTQRVEVQIYRLVNAGKHNGTRLKNCRTVHPIGFQFGVRAALIPQMTFTDSSPDRFASERTFTCQICRLLSRIPAEPFIRSSQSLYLPASICHEQMMTVY